MADIAFLSVVSPGCKKTSSQILKRGEIDRAAIMLAGVVQSNT
jgi:hypothetical protein